MKKFGNFICTNKIMIVIISFVLLLISLVGMVKTKINYDILVYLPKDIETMKGQDILTEDFNMGSFATLVVDNMSDKDILLLEDKIKKIEGVEKVISVNDVVGTTIPLSFLPNEVTKKVQNGNTKIIFTTFKNGTSDSKTLDAVNTIRKITDNNVKVGGMSSMVLDTMNLSNSEITIYIVIAVLLCIIVLSLALDSYVVPFILLMNIGIAIMYNMGTNIFLGNISYITKAISSVLQLGVTTDFSIFLYHKYEDAKKKKKDRNSAMTEAISETMISVVGSSLTTIAGFLALCTMNLTLGRDIGIVMAKGVFLGVLSVLIIFPALLLVFDKQIEKTTHKVIIPKFTRLNNFVIKNYKVIFALFLILLVPTWYGNKNTKVYYNLDKSLPSNLESSVANDILKEKFNIVSPEVILISKNIKSNQVEEMVEKIEKLPGIDTVISPSKLESMGLTDDILGSKITSIYKSDKYQMIIVNSSYKTATNELNKQIGKVNKIVKEYDSEGILAGEGPLMKDLVNISDQDFHNVNYTSLLVIFIIMIFVLKSISLPVLLIFVIEFAIFINMGIPYYTNITIPFIASIVIGTIQLGATIDYAILMTTKYLDERKNGKDRFKAIDVALSSSSNSIFVSGMCFFAATFGVGVFSKLDMISTLCTLISRGAIVSMIVVITVLPSFLIIFDKLICKTTKGFKKEGEKMKNSKIKYALFIMLISMFSLTDVNALTKNETVFSHLDYNGKVKNTVVNEHLTGINNDKKIEDVTTLKDILNINGDEKFSLDGNKLSFENKGNEIYYSGKSDKELPIDVEVTYKLNDKDISLDDLLGKSGKVEININYINKSKYKVNVNGTKKELYTPFVVTMGTIIPTKNVSDVEVTNGKVTSTGNNNIVVALATPGLASSLDSQELASLNNIVITYNTKNFKLNNIYSVATSKLLDDNDFKIFDKLDGIYSKASKLNSASKELVSGANKLAEGSNKLYDGSKLLSNTLNSKINAAKKNNALTDADKSMIAQKVKSQVLTSFTDSKVSEIENNAASAIDREIASYEVTVNNLESNQQFMGLVNICSSGNIPVEYQEACYQNSSNIENYMTAKGIVSNDSIKKLMKETAKKTAVVTAKSVATQTAESVSVLVAEEVANSAKLKTISELEVLSENINKLTMGISELNDGVNLLSTGITKFDKEGIEQISNYITKDLKTKAKTVEKLKELGDNYTTYTMKNNSDKGSTKFVLVVDGKEKETVKKKSTAKKNKKSFFGKISN